MKIREYVMAFCAVLAMGCAGVCAAGAENAMQCAVDRFSSDSTLRYASVGICVMRIDSATIVAGHAAEQSMITASTMKTVTSATALEVLGKDFTFGTQVYALGEIDRHGTLRGNLVVRGGGDPTLGSRYFADRSDFVDSVVAAVKHAGIRKINGRVEVDASLIPYPPVSPRWMVEDLSYDYGAGCFGLCFADNVLTVSFDRSGEEPTDFIVTPGIDGLAVNSRVALGDKGDIMPVDYVEALMDYDTPAINLWGGTYRSEQRFSDTFANPVPHRLLLDSLCRALKAEDVNVRGKNIDIDELRDVHLVADYRSPQLPEVLKSLLYRSNNMFTEMVLRAVALHDDGAATAANGIAKVKALWRSKGVPVDALFMYDGSGLARNGKASARFLCELLRSVQADSDSIGVVFSSLLPLAGVSGTLKSLLAGTPLQGKIALKSGSMGDVQCFAGFYPAENPQYTVAILVNNYSCSRKTLRRNIEKLLLELFSE